jgi:type IV fimbrial biogenesis protein FimT
LSVGICRWSDTYKVSGKHAYIARMTSKYQSGFTLYELLITMLVIGVILTLGIPSFSDFTQNSRIASTANDLHSSFHLARSEAARAKAPVTICASADPMGAALCDGASFDGGWIIFVDLNGDIQRAGAGENVLRAHPPVDTAINVTTNAGADYFGFAATGLGRGDVGGQPSVSTATICDGRGNIVAAGGNSAARFLVVTPIGRATVLRDVGQIAGAGGCP